MAQTPIPKNPKGRYPVPGKKIVEVDLGSNDPKKFAVVQKPLDPKLPTSFEGIKITWFNAFGIRHRKANLTLGDYAETVSYTIYLEAVPAGKSLFAYYGGQVHKIKFSIVAGETKATLTVGDPPIGWGP